MKFWTSGHLCQVLLRQNQHAYTSQKSCSACHYIISKAVTTHSFFTQAEHKLLSIAKLHASIRQQKGFLGQAKPRLSSAAEFSTRLPLPGATPGFSGLPMPLEVRGREDTIDMCLTAGILLQNQWFWKRRKTASISTPLVSGRSRAAHMPINTHMAAKHIHIQFQDHFDEYQKSYRFQHWW